MARIKQLQGGEQFSQALFQAIFERSLEAIAIVDRQNRSIELNSAACQLLGVSRQEAIGEPIDRFFIDPIKKQSQNKIAEAQICHADGTITTVEYSFVEEIIADRDLLVLREVGDLKRAEVELDLQHQRAKLFTEVTLKIRDSLQLKDVLQTTVSEIQRILQADRVLIYQVFENGTGKTISEAVLSEYKSILGIEFSEEVFPSEYRELYSRGRVRAIDDVRSAEANLTDCLLEFVDEWQVRAKLVVPIVQNLPSQGRRLWGLLIAHQCRDRRQWTEFEGELLQQLADQIGIALAQAELLENLEGLVAERTTELQREIEERLKVEAALRHSEEQLRSIANGLPVLIAYVDDKQCYRFNNEAYETWLGLSPDGIRGCSLDIVHDREEYAKISPYIERVLSGEMVTYENDLTFINGSIHSLSVTYIPHIENLQGTSPAGKRSKQKILGFFALASDISEIKAIKRIKDEFISIVSHELRTPLTSIHSSLKILATGKLSSQSEKETRMLTIADEQTERLVRLVNNVLDLQSLQSGKVQMLCRACRADELVIEAVRAMQTLAQEHEINIHIDAVDRAVWADSDYIVQTLTNLLSNAIKFSPPNSSIWVSAKRKRQTKTGKKTTKSTLLDRRAIVFSVKDRGQGIPNESLEMIFERFQQVDSSDSRKKGGTGLGLAICRQIVEGHGGRIWAESILGDGSTFYFTLPEYESEE